MKAFTPEELKTKRYSVCFNRPQGWPYKPESCAAEVMENNVSNYKRLGQCRSKPGHGPDGLYCKKHAEQLEQHT